jgi:glycosyltransferase involved in cell wall biosynthesis
MRIAIIIPGSGGSFYCENCLRDSGLAAGLQRAGFEAFPVPMYLPLFAGDASFSRPSSSRRAAPLFYGAIALYLRQQSAFFRRLPAAFDRLFNARPFLSLAAGLAGSTRAAGLEEMTVSMLLGEEGNQAAELEQLIGWLEREAKPDVVHLSNALLLGLAPALRSRLGVPVICSLQDEHVWIEPMAERARERVWSLLAEKAKAVDRFVAVSEYYRNEMAPKLNIDPAAIAVVPLGVDPPQAGCRVAPTEPVIGFLSRLERSSGLDTLVTTLAALKTDPALANARLNAYGGLTGDDVPFVRQLKRTVRRLGLADSVSLVTSYDRGRRFEFLRGLSVLCVPRREPEAFGMFLIEALIQGVPVVAPEEGGFTEIVKATGGGLLYPPGDERALTEALRRVLTDAALAGELGDRGCARARELYSLDRTAAVMGQVYRSLAK